MSKEPFKSFINKVGTFRSKKNVPNQRPSASDLRFSDTNDENMFKLDENSSALHDSDLDTTSKSFSSANNISFRSSVQTLAASHLPNLNIYDQMTQDQINEEFEKSILTLNLKSDKDIEKMRSLPLESKKSLLINMRKNENEMDDKATNMANALREAVRNSKNLKENLKQLHKVIKRISVCIASKPVSWLEEFNQASGFQALQEIITDYKTKYSILYNNSNGSQYYNSNFLTGTLLPGSQNTYNSNEFKDKDTQLSKEIRFECMKTLKSFVNTSYGISVVLESKPTLMAIATAIDCNDTPTMNVACSLLAVLAVLDQEKVLAAITESAKFTGNHRFYSIVKGLTINEDKELKISSMILINALICNADSLDFKIHLRSDFNKCGLSSAIDSLKVKYGSLDESLEKESDKLMKQIAIFESHAQDNFEKMDNYFDNIVGFWEDPKTCFEYLYNSIKDSPVECCLLSILQHLLLIRDDMHVKYSYFRLIEECVSRIALHRDGRDPDFKYGPKFDFDIDSMLKALKDASQSDLSDQSGRMSNADSKKLENAISEKQELEAKCHTLDTKLKCTEDALNQLKQKVPNEVASEIEAMLAKRLNELSSPPPPPPPPPMLAPLGGPPPPPPPMIGFGGPPPPPPMMGGPPPPPPPPMMGFGGPPPPPPPMGGPPPPPPMMGGPPPPPSLQRGPPPPPLNALPFGMKEKKKFSVDQPLKRINWSKIQTTRLKENSFWVKANEEKFATDDVIKILLENFSTKPAKSKVLDSKNSTDEPTLKKKATAKELKYLDDKQAQNLSILLKSFKANPQDIYKWLIECDLDRLTQNSLEQLEKFLPEDKILVKYQELKENIDDLDPSEKFLVIISQIKGLRKRIRSLIFKCKFPEQQDEIRVDLVAGTQACIDVRNSEKFQKLLEVFLLVGNFLNSGSNSLEGSIGFDMKYLPKFYGTKANDNKRTLLHLVSQIISDKHPQIENFYDDFKAFLEQASKIDASVIQKNLSEMKTSINNSDLDLKSFKNKCDHNDKYLEIMESFLKDARNRYETLECMFNKMNDSYKDLAEFYVFEITKYPLGEFFTDLKTFCNQFEQCIEENMKYKETEEKIRRAEEERINREKEKQARKAQKEKLIQSTTNRGDGDTGVMDNLLEALQSGKLFEATNPNTNGPGRRRPMRRDHNLMADFRRTMHKQSPRAVLQEVQ